MNLEISRIPISLSKEHQIVKLHKESNIHTIVTALDMISENVMTYATETPLDLVVAQNIESEIIDIEIICLKLEDRPLQIEDSFFKKHIATLEVDNGVYVFAYIVPRALREDES
jgi:hypothetical protein